MSVKSVETRETKKRGSREGIIRLWMSTKHTHNEHASASRGSVRFYYGFIIQKRLALRSLRNSENGKQLHFINITPHIKGFSKDISSRPLFFFEQGIFNLGFPEITHQAFQPCLGGWGVCKTPLVRQLLIRVARRQRRESRRDARHPGGTETNNHDSGCYARSHATHRPPTAATARKQRIIKRCV